MEPIITIPVITGAMIFKGVLAFATIHASYEIICTVSEFLKEGKADADGTQSQFSK